MLCNFRWTVNAGHSWKRDTTTLEFYVFAELYSPLISRPAIEVLVSLQGYTNRLEKKVQAQLSLAV